jgi:tetratricopeptide (TPR) repeat protein
VLKKYLLVIITLLFISAPAEAAGLLRFGALPLQPVPGGEEYAWLAAATNELTRLRFGYLNKLAISTGYGQYNNVKKWGKKLPFTAKEQDLPPIFNDLGVDAFIFGRYQGYEEQLKIEIQLARNSQRGRLSKVISETFTSSHVGEIASKVVFLTIGLCAIAPTPAESSWLERHPTDSFYAFRDYGRAILAYQRGDMQSALELINYATANDREFIEAALLRAEILYCLGRYNETIQAFEETANLAINILGQNHPQVAAIRSRYGQILQLFGFTDVAQKEIIAARALAQKIFGPGHPNTATVMNNLAATYTAKGQTAEATKLLESALLTVNRTLGTKHPQVADLSGNLAMVYYSQVIYQKAISFAKLATELAELNLSGNDDSLAYRYNQLALCLSAKSLYSEALIYAQKALDIFDKVYGETHPMTIQTTSDVGAIYFASGSFERALEHYRRALKRSKQVMGPSSAQAAQELSNVAAVYFQMGAYQESKEYYLQALAIFQQLGQARNVNFVQRQLALIEKKQRPTTRRGYYLQ